MDFLDYLKKFGYPNINQLTEEEVANIFNTSNRIFFLSWIAQILDSTLKFDPNAEETPALLADFVYENGFCLASQKNKFVCGGLNLIDQLIIMKRMFSMLSINDDKLTNDSISIADVASLCNAQPLNLFPGLGSSKSIGPEEIDALQKDCDEIEEKVKEIENHVKEIVHQDFDHSNVAQHDFKQSAAFMTMNSSMLSQKKGAFYENNFAFNGSNDSVKETAEKLDAALKILKNTEVIVDFPEKSKHILLRNMSETYTEVAATIKDIASLVDTVKN